jgi:predicted nucleic acid-binding protein
MRYLLDADWVINALAGKRGADTAVGDLSDAGIAIAATTVGEIYEGAFGAPDPVGHLAFLRTFLAPFQVIQLEDPVIERFARIRYQLRRQGSLIPDFDLLIAATALELDLIVLTFNVRHFERIDGIRLYPASAG